MTVWKKKSDSKSVNLSTGYLKVSSKSYANSVFKSSKHLAQTKL